MQLSSNPVDFPSWGRVWAESMGACCVFFFFFNPSKEKEMNLSSCVADSVVLSFDSAGQTLGSGTNPSLSILSALSTWAAFGVEPGEVVVGSGGVSGEGGGVS